jgi:hypothetical protein
MNWHEVVKSMLPEHLLLAGIVILLTPVMVKMAGAYHRVTVWADGRLYEGQPSRLSKLVLWAKTNCAPWRIMPRHSRSLPG